MRLVRHTVWMLSAVAIALSAHSAQAQPALNISLGYFAVNGEDARPDGDVLVANREILLFDIRDFDTGSIGGELLLPIGEFLEVGAGVGFTSRTVPSIYDDLVNRDGSEIAQDLKLRIVPMTATVRLLPFGRSRPVQPYVGGGIGAFNYRYSEVGDFVDFTDRSVFRDAFVAKGTELGGVALAGIRFPVSDNWSLGGEVRWQKAEADLNDDFLGTTLDLGGFHYLATLHVKF
jgi:opacity protein-like surface antigen